MRLIDPRLERWLAALLETPGLTSIRDRAEARRVHVEESLAAVEVVERFPGPIVDVGSGGGAPGIPLAAALPERQVTLLEANGRKCAFLRDVAREFPNVEVVQGRAEKLGAERYGVAVAKALAAPTVAAEWCLPLVIPGGAVVLFVGPSADTEAVSRVSKRLGGGPAEQLPGLLVLPKLTPTPPGFPRRPGVAKKRPLA
ncbi:MAG: 16S rRNA (guanine(527)-N(7))-methyltransferase RsmG [Gaiellaceae bacterium]